MSGVLTAWVAAAGSAAVDPYFNYTTLLLPGTGTNGAQNNTFLDSSTNNFTITRNGNTTQGTLSPFSPTGWSNYFKTSRISAGPSASLTLSSNNFTVECWFYPLGFDTAYAAIWDFRVGAGFQAASPFIYLGTNGALNYNNTLQSSISLALNVWTHIAIVRNNNVITMYFNGSSVGSVSENATMSNTYCFIGAPNDTFQTYYTNAYISNCRLVINQALYTGNFTPATSALTANTVGATGAGAAANITGTVALLTCQSNRFVDNSINNFVLTVSGTPSVQAFSPFAPSAAYSPALHGGSGYFDGSGDFLTCPNVGAITLSASNFTIECWVYLTSTSPNYQGIIDFRASSGSIHPEFGLAGNSFVWFISGIGSVITSSAVSLYTWNHVVVCRFNGSTRMFLNGIQAGSTYADTNFYLSANPIRIGNTYDNFYFYGYISDLRVLNGTGLYSSNFAPPTAPLTAISNTSLLLNFTNAGIVDATTKNLLETVDGAQIKTTINNPFGVPAGTMYFDGTGDWLLMPHTTNQLLGTAAFTIEMWVYRNASGTYGLVGKGTSTTGWLVSLNLSNQLVFTYGTGTITSSGTITSAAWTYIAVVREGTGANQTKIYISGTLSGTGTVSTDFTQTNNVYVGADRTAGNAFNGYISNLRITRGVARAITTPDKPFALR